MLCYTLFLLKRFNKNARLKLSNNEETFKKHRRAEAPFTLYRLIRKRRGNVPFWPTVYTEPYSYPASIDDY